ncbi:restriction endonuclease subunit S [Acinetobacter baumannii]|uniref:restriction endonuclease subunit S n=1 Tax=Acinetobacter baumannii TaxID=470 RepID=UPI0013D18B4E|nr:restriction endonuclease subunit S [Acinetobacter baumannii]
MSQLPRYESYKDSGVQWLGEIPNHWVRTNVKYYYDVQLGKMLQPEAKSVDDINIKYLKAQHVQWEKIDSENMPEMWCSSKELSKYMVSNGDLLICEGGEVGRCGILTNLEEPAIIQNALHRVRNTARADVRYLNYFIQHTAQSDWFSILCNKATIAHFTSEKLLALPTLIPPLGEQKIIADFLDKRLTQVDALIAKQETLLEKLAEQRVALISHVVTKGLNPDVEMKESGMSTLGEIPLHWEIIKNKFIFDFSKGLTITKENLVDEGIPCVSYGEVHSKFGFEVDPNKHQLKCVPETYIESDENSLLKYGDFIFADTSEDVKGSGNFTYLNSDIPTFAGYHTIIAKMSKLNNPRFLAYILDTEEHRNQIRMLIKGVKVFSITQAILKNTFVWLPPIDEQNQIVDYLDQEVEKYQQIGQRYELTIKRLKEYRSTLITQVVTGKIDVRNLKVN